MTVIILSFSAALMLALLLTRAVRAWGLRAGWVDYPDGNRHAHATPVPRIGGVAIYLSVALVVGVALLLGSVPIADFQGRPLVALLAGGAAIFAIGLYDDTRGLTARTKFLLEVGVAVAVYFCGIQLTGFGLPDGGSVWFPPWLSLPLTLIWLVGVTNAFNLIDGSDGVAAGAALFATASILFVSLLSGNELAAIFAIVLAGATLGFLFYNFPPASVFLGDSGSLFIGFTLAGLGLVTTQTAPTALAVAIPVVSFGLPILDTVLAMARRFLRGETIFNADRGHIHHRLLDLGHSPRRVALILYGACAAFAMLSLLLINPEEPAVAAVFLVSGAVLWLAVQRLHIPELLELGRIIGRGRYHRVAIASNVRLREAVRRLRLAGSGQNIVEAAAHAFVGGEFDRVEVWLDSTTARPLVGCPGVTSQPHGYLWSWTADRPEGALCWEMKLQFTDESGHVFGRLSLWRPVQDGLLLADVRLLAADFRTEFLRALQRLNGCSAAVTVVPLAVVAEERKVSDVLPSLAADSPQGSD